jgi:hypothetical protein
VSGATRFLKRGVLEEGADRGQAKVAGADGIVAVVLNVIQERADERRVEIVQRELRRRFFELLLGKTEKQPERIAVRDDGVGTGLALIHKAISEKGLKQSG